MQANIDARVMAGETMRQIADALGLAPVTVARHSVAAREARLAAGLTCGCGRAIGHPGWCSAKWDDAGLPRGRRPFESSLEQRATSALLTGRPIAELAPELGVTATALRKLQASFTADQSSIRARAIRERRKMSDADVASRIKARVEAAVSQGIDADVRDDIIGEIWLAVIDGRIEEGDIKRVARSFAARGLAEWQSRWGPKSLDATLPDGTRTLGDLVEDTTTADQLEEINIGDHGND